MTRRHTATKDSSDAELTEALAALIACTRSKKRPLPLTTIAEWVRVAVAKLGSYEAVSERIDLTSKMLRQFTYVDRLSKPVRDLFDSRILDSVDAATHLAMLPKKDQAVVARALAGGLIDTSDVRAVVQWREARPAEPIRQLVNGVSDSKTQQRYVAEFIVRETGERRRLLNMFRKYIRAEDIIDVEIVGAFGRLVLTKNGKDQLFRAAKTLGVSASHAIAEILSGPRSK